MSILARWEPPKVSQVDRPRVRRERTRKARRELPEIWLMAGTRAAITALLAATVMLDEMRDQLHWVVLALIGGLAFIISQSHQVHTLRLRDQSIIDLAVLLTVVPVAVMTGFVAAGSGALLPAEQSTFLQLSIATIIALGVVALLSIRLFARDQPDIPTMTLPAVLIIISLPFVLHDYRNQTVLAMIAVSYFLATVAIPFGIVVDEAVRRYIGAMFAGATALVGVLLFDPGLANLGERAELIELVIWGIILFGIVVLFALSHVPALVPGLAPGSERSHDVIRTIRDRRGDDSGRPVER